jgi:hypothetical protein
MGGVHEGAEVNAPNAKRREPCPAEASARRIRCIDPLHRSLCKVHARNSFALAYRFVWINEQ